MTRLDLAAAPEASRPRMFLTLVPLWGALAAGLLWLDGAEALGSRWAPAAVALVHALTLGVLGNAVLGALLQFLPAAVGVVVAGGRPAANAICIVFNAGALALVVGLRLMAPVALVGGGVMLVAALVGFVCCVGVGLPHAPRRDAVARGIGLGLACLLAAAAMGLGMAFDLGWRPGLLPPTLWADRHAGWALAGGGLLLVASVAQVVVPMFQGASAMASRAFATWAFVLLLALVLLAVGQPVARPLLAATVAAWALSTLHRQWRRRHARNTALWLGWQGACVALLCAAASLASGGDARFVGALVLGAALPLFLVPMLLEIDSFLAWIQLQRAVPRGVRVPALHHLLPDDRKGSVVALHALAAVVLPVAVYWPGESSARVAGTAAFAAYAATGVVLAAMRLRAARFLATVSRP